MKNLRVNLHKVDGGLQEFQYANGQEIILAWLGDDFGAPPRVLSIEAEAEDGSRVRINISNDMRKTVLVKIDRVQEQSHD